MMQHSDTNEKKIFNVESDQLNAVVARDEFEVVDLYKKFEF